MDVSALKKEKNFEIMKSMTDEKRHENHITIIVKCITISPTVSTMNMNKFHLNVRSVQWRKNIKLQQL